MSDLKQTRPTNKCRVCGIEDEYVFEAYPGRASWDNPIYKHIYPDCITALKHRVAGLEADINIIYKELHDISGLRGQCIHNGEWINTGGGGGPDCNAWTNTGGGGGGHP